MKRPVPRLAPLPSRRPPPIVKNSTAPALTKVGRGGRPPKYAEPSRPITVTLPEKTLRDLEQIHEDRGQAIVKLTAAAHARPPGSHPKVEIVEMAANTGLLVVGRCKALDRIPFLHLVEVAPGRFLLALDPGNDFKTLELALQDVLEELPEGSDDGRELVFQLLGQIRHVRKAARVSMAEILFVKLQEARADEAAAGCMLMQAFIWLSALAV